MSFQSIVHGKFVCRMGCVLRKHRRSLVEHKRKWGLKFFVLTVFLGFTQSPQDWSMTDRACQVICQQIRVRDHAHHPHIEWAGLCSEHFVWDCDGSRPCHSLSSANRASSALVRFSPQCVIWGQLAVRQCVKDMKQKLMVQINKTENKTRADHQQTDNDKLTFEASFDGKGGADRHMGPHTVKLLKCMTTALSSSSRWQSATSELSTRHGTSVCILQWLKRFCVLAKCTGQCF